MTVPDVSVLMTAYDAEPFVRSAVNSVLDQRGPTLEVVVVDDGSGDGTTAVLRQYALMDARVRVIELASNRGQSFALQVGLEHCRGTYIARLDADDVCYQGRIERQMAAVESCPNGGFAGCGAMRIDMDGRELGPWYPVPTNHDEFVARLRTFRPVCPHSGFFLRRALLTQVGGYGVGPAEDFDLMLRISEVPAVRFTGVNDPLVGLRMHATNMSYNSARRVLTKAVVALACHMLRSGGVTAVDYSRVEAAVVEVIGRTGLDRTTTARAMLITAFIDLRAGRYVSAAQKVMAAVMTRPSVIFGTSTLPESKVRAAAEVVRGYPERT